ncbi:U3 small nucleolar RNA-associated protein 13 [Clydaea vesicula]|uniref:U3 small nucleolar RNA-associated protein 13 n=1 Tax=Clydaea vesicula TaxID=447962 RepID=A0AAD5XX75_9FUNG|nr:U3 small nucleolar RNA-associated protein 13 [Clydaea vesicula]KAJ3381852.1 U3 small nucleolar RNA-associated protein 13 [Lobulomyces angularis]
MDISKQCDKTVLMKSSGYEKEKILSFNDENNRLEMILVSSDDEDSSSFDSWDFDTSILSSNINNSANLGFKFDKIEKYETFAEESRRLNKVVNWPVYNFEEESWKTTSIQRNEKKKKNNNFKYIKIKNEFIERHFNYESSKKICKKKHNNWKSFSKVQIGSSAVNKTLFLDNSSTVAVAYYAEKSEYNNGNNLGIFNWEKKKYYRLLHGHTYQDAANFEISSTVDDIIYMNNILYTCSAFHNVIQLWEYNVDLNSYFHINNMEVHPSANFGANALCTDEKNNTIGAALKSGEILCSKIDNPYVIHFENVGLHGSPAATSIVNGHGVTANAFLCGFENKRGHENIMLIDKIKVLPSNKYNQPITVSDLAINPQMQVGGWTENKSSNNYYETLRVFDCRIKKEVLLISSEQNDVNRVGYSYDGEFFYSAGENSQVLVYDSKFTKKPIYKLSHPHNHIRQEGVRSVIWTRDDFLFTGGQDDLVKIWDMKTGNLMKEINFGSSITSMSLSNDEKYLCVGLESSKVELLTLGSYKAIDDIKFFPEMNE